MLRRIKLANLSRTTTYNTVVNQNNAALSPSQLSPSLPVAEETPVARKRRWPLFLGLGVCGIAVVGGGALVGAYSSYSAWQSSAQLAPNIFINGEAVGGLSKHEAQSRLEKRFGRLFLDVQTPQRTFKLSLNELGGTPKFAEVVEKAYKVGRDSGTIENFLVIFGAQTGERRYALPIEWEKDSLKRKLYTVNYLYKTAPKSAELKVSGAGVQVVPETLGRALNIGATAENLQKRYYLGLREVEATTRLVKPRLLAADLRGRDVKLEEYTTRFNPGDRGRTKNVIVAAQAVSGAVIMPDETFSFNSMTGERTAHKGYRMAHIFITKPGESEAEVADGLAGGTCQVSSTLYNAVRKTNNKTEGGLKIVERNHHSLPVTYVPRGLDATVAWPGKDFRFRNTFPHPVYLKTVINGSRLTVSVWARVTDGGEAPITAQLPEDSTERTG